MEGTPEVGRHGWLLQDSLRRVPVLSGHHAPHPGRPEEPVRDCAGEGKEDRALRGGGGFVGN